MRVLIIGGGLSGLAVAEMLEQRGRDYLLLEARERFGGRILTRDLAGTGFDMGPAWFWPGQPRIAALIDRLGLSYFAQRTEGAQLFETPQGQLQRGRGYAQMPGSWRMTGGLGTLVDALAGRLPAARKRLSAEVRGLVHAADEVIVTLATGEQITGTHAVLAMPPRVAAGFSFAPALPDRTQTAMCDIATWMAGHAKAVAVYDRPFWRDAGLSGDATSQKGPLVEVHDASPADGGPYALFGFLGVPPAVRRDNQSLKRAITAQLIRLFGPDAAQPKTILFKDWAFDPFTATDADHAPLFAHPTYGLPPAMQNLWDGQLLWAGTEVAPQFGGYLEGALEASENVLDHLNRHRRESTDAG